MNNYKLLLIINIYKYLIYVFLPLEKYLNILNALDEILYVTFFRGIKAILSLYMYYQYNLYINISIIYYYYYYYLFL